MRQYTTKCYIYIYCDIFKVYIANKFLFYFYLGCAVKYRQSISKNSRAEGNVDKWQPKVAHTCGGCCCGSCWQPVEECGSDSRISIEPVSVRTGSPVG